MAVSEGKVITNSSVSGFVSTGGNDTITGGKDFTGPVSVLDASFSIKDDADPTKIAKFQVSALTAGATRTFTLPDTTGMLVLTNQTTTTLGSVTTAQTLNIGAGITSTGNTKTANLATAGASGSTTNINIGSATAGALGTLTINSPTVAFAATVTAVNLPTGTTAPTAAHGDNSTAPATTAFVQNLVAYGQLTADYTLTSTTAIQKLFNFSTNGTLDLATGRYAFKVMLYVTGMSAAAADNLRFRIGAGGTATLANVWYQSIGQDSASAMAVGALSGSGAVTALSELNVVSGAAAAESFLTIAGWFNVTAAGTIIPSCNLNTAAAAVVKAGSGIIVEYLGPTGSNTKGTWT